MAARQNKKNYAIEIADRTGVNLSDVRKVLNVIKDSDSIFNELIKDIGGHYLKGSNPPVRGLINNIDRVDFNLTKLVEARLRSEVEPAKFDEMINAISGLVGKTKELAQEINTLAYEKKNKDQEEKKKAAVEAKKKKTTTSKKEAADGVKEAV